MNARTKHPSQAHRVISLQIEGITCASCVGRVEKALKAVPGVENANVNLATERADVVVTEQIEYEALVRGVEQAGYSVSSAPIKLAIEGMICASCVGRLERALQGVPGVVSATVNLATEQATIQGNADEALLVKAVEQSGYTAHPTDRRGSDRVAPITVIGDWFTSGPFESQKPQIEAMLGQVGRNETIAGAPKQRPVVHRPQVGQVIDLEPGQTILSAVLEKGIPYPHYCRSGQCGKCKSRLLEGEVSLLGHTEFSLSEEEKANGQVLACCAVPTKGSVSVEWLGPHHEKPDHPERRLQCRFSAIDAATHDIRRARLALDGQPFSFSASQHARLSLEGLPARDYSMANRPDRSELEFHIRRVPDGETSSFIHSHLKPGECVTLEGPFGFSHLRQEHSGPIVAVAGGSGLAPIHSIVATALHLGMDQPIHVYFGVHTERDLYMLDHFQSLVDTHRNLIFTPVLSDQPSARYRTGMVSGAIAEDLENLDGWKAYVVGPPPMVKATTLVLAAAGLQSRNLHADVFFTPEEH
ncbi:cation transporter [Roseinatronobacter alkalisoli]|uniref:Cation transporter n=1 Tax=Roseinatronobacter alkalisoli TaxID=3028235 RepID=A0ABT5TED9_9RHOB|nr:cation transporter [Roseinatronobacter sp. HJB301]MDD7973464.1 cation transporter [Roseinatronobacter sp. HJB301]